MSKPLIVVTGATGQQGGALARALLRRGRYGVRALTRNPDSEKAKALKSGGAEVVKADLDGDLPSLEKVLKGAHGAFLVTNFWEHGDPDREYKQGTNFAKAAKNAGIKHLVFSGLENVEKITGGRLKCAHFSAKGRVEDFIATHGLPNHTFVRMAAYAESMVQFAIKKSEADDGTFTFSIPLGENKMHILSIEDSGDAVAAIFERAEEFRGKAANLAGDYLSGNEFAGAVSRLVGKTVNYTPIPLDVYRKLPFPGADDTADMFEFYIEKGESLRDVALTKSLNPSVQNFEQFLKNNKALIEKATT